MDPTILLAFATQALRVIELAQWDWREAPPALKEARYARAAKLEAALLDPVVDALAGALKKLPPPVLP